MHRSIPFAIGALFLILIGCGIYGKARMAVAPPIYDPISYYIKAKVVWDALSKGDFAGTLNGVFAIRPPGSAVLLYPLGFKASIQGFLFRSVFVPIVIWTFALAITAAAFVHRKSDAIVGGCLTVGLATLPLFYQFEYSAVFDNTYQISNYWGLVDPLQGAVSALAVCLLAVGIKTGSLSLCIGGWLSSALSLFVKPSGALVMAATIGIAAIELVIRYLRYPEQRPLTLRFAAWAFLSCIPVFGLAFWAALGSDYLGKETVSAAIKAQGIVRLITQGQDLTALFVRFIVPVIGWWWFFAMAFCLTLFIIETMTSIVRRQFNPIGLRLAGCFILASLAVFWWLFLAGTQHRYLFPFILMIIIWLVPDVLERISKSGALMKSAIACYSLAPASLLTFLLWSAHPLMSLQKAMGINLSAGQYAFEVEVGEKLLSKAERLGRPIDIYSLGHMRVGVVEMIDWVQSIEAKDGSRKFRIGRPLNWIDMPGLRLQEIAQSDFLIMEDVRSPNASSTSIISISDWREEVEQFKQFIYLHHDIDKNGLELLDDGSVKVLRVVNKERFADALNVWAESIRWGNDFPERNTTFLGDRQ